MDLKEIDDRRKFAIGYASGMFARYYLTNKDNFNKFLEMIDEKDKNDLLKILLLDN